MHSHYFAQLKVEYFTPLRYNVHDIFATHLAILDIVFMYSTPHNLYCDRIIVHLNYSVGLKLAFFMNISLSLKIHEKPQLVPQRKNKYLFISSL